MKFQNKTILFKTTFILSKAWKGNNGSSPSPNMYYRRIVGSCKGPPLPIYVAYKRDVRKREVMACSLQHADESINVLDMILHFENNDY